jgi:pyrrolysine biosynthesis protein PylD
VGRAAATYLTKKEIPVFIYDTYIGRAKKMDLPGVFVLDKCDLHGFKYILCAANSGEFIYKKDITPGTFISAPGMPLCLSDSAKPLVKLFHNPLELGVAVMYFECLKGLFS